MRGEAGLAVQPRVGLRRRDRDEVGIAAIHTDRRDQVLRCDRDAWIVRAFTGDQAPRGDPRSIPFRPADSVNPKATPGVCAGVPVDAATARGRVQLPTFPEPPAVRLEKSTENGP